MPDDEHAPNDKLTLFHGADAPDLAEADMSTGRRHIADEPLDDFFSEASVADFKGVVPFRQQGRDGFSLIRLEMAPGAILPRHSHSSDCLYYIVSGQVFLGSQELGSGDGFFAPADQPYGYRVGADGVVLLEIRHSTAFDTTFTEPDPGAFRARAEASLAAAAAARSSS